MSSSSELQGTPSRQTFRLALLIVFVFAVLCLPFVLLGESYAIDVLESQAGREWMLVAIAIALLTADSVAPVPSVLVIMLLAAKVGWWAGLLAGTVGLTGQAVSAAWLGRVALGRIAPRLFPDAELARLRAALQQRLTLTLGCMRSIPVFAETSVILAGSLGISVRKVFWATLAPNCAISLIYSVAAENSFATACIAFAATAAVSYVIWRLAMSRTNREIAEGRKHGIEGKVPQAKVAKEMPLR